MQRRLAATAIAPIALIALIALIAGTVIAPGLLVALAPVALLVVLSATGAWRLRNPQRRTRRHVCRPAHAGRRSEPPIIDPEEFDNECELATFAALQRAAQRLEVAEELLFDAGTDAPDLAAAIAGLGAALEAFVFSGEGLGDLAAAWTLEESTSRLASQAALRWRRPAS